MKWDWGGWSRATDAALRRLSRFASAVRQGAAPVWKAATIRVARWWWWLGARRGIVFWTAGLSMVVALLIGFIAAGGAAWYGRHHEAVAPLLTLTAGVAVAAVALLRHFAQTDADRQRRITESFAKAIEQLGSDKLEVRLGGIYSLERISKESPDDYWTVMENLTAFVRERSRRNEAERTAQDFKQRVSRCAYFLWREAGQPDGRAEEFWAAAIKQDEFGEPPAADIEAALTVIKRRSEQSRERERTNDWRLDLSGAVLKRANLSDAHLERAILKDAHLEGAKLSFARLEKANLDSTRLERADLSFALLDNAFLLHAHLEGATCMLGGMYLEGAILEHAHLGGVDLSDADGLSMAHVLTACGDAATQLPEGMARPSHWPAPVPYK